ncbi:MAG: glutamyl-tRNA reductase [Flavobacteriales bacterium]|nr:glutamyl-tRNA reductase [Flavobacteriales bacterium]MCB9449585.1 glutamyl-tRNA reductase [Flavobacteriales bacterium]
MKRFKIIALTHKTATLEEVGRLHIPDEEWQSRLSALKQALSLSEIMYLSTCNRVEFLVAGDDEVNDDYLKRFFRALQPEWPEQWLNDAVEKASVWQEHEALQHIFHVTASLDSMVVGEREIITQVRQSYEKCRDMGLTGDLLRLVAQHAIQTAKRVYTETHIADRPVSVVSLAYRRLREFKLADNARFLIIGAGQTIGTMVRYLNKHGFRNFVVFNRTLSNAQILAEMLQGEAHELSTLKDYKGGFDVMITCTGAADPVVTEPVYRNLLQGESDPKIIIDLAIPHDVDPVINTRFNTSFIQVHHLKTVAAENLAEREKELKNCYRIVDEEMSAFLQLLRGRRVELAMQQVPEKVKEIRENAMKNVFARELESLDEQSREIVDRMLAYMEKKYISVPMKMAREIILGNEA